MKTMLTMTTQQCTADGAAKLTDYSTQGGRRASVSHHNDQPPDTVYLMNQTDHWNDGQTDTCTDS